MAEDVSVLGHRVRLPVIGRYLAQLGLVLALLLTVPLGVALVFGNAEFALRLVLTAAVLVVSGISLLRQPATERIQTNEALVIAAGAFIMAGIAVGYVLSAEPGVSAVDALFEGISAVTTTGLSTIGSVETRSPTFLLTRAWVQWFGGLGIVVLTVALVSGHHAASRRLVEPVGENGLDTTTRLHARRMSVIYLLLTGVALALIVPFSEEPLTGLAHVLTAVSTGGFSTYDDSLAGFSAPGIPVALMFFAFLGATPLPAYYRVYRRAAGALADPELLALVFAVALTVALTAWLAPELSLREALLLGASAQTGTGFTPVTVSTLPPASLIVLTLAMLAGGTVGSTAGGIKMFRILLLLRLVQTIIRRTALPSHAVLKARIGRHPVKAGDFERAALVLILFLAVVLASWLVFVAAGYPPLESLFEVSSATGTVGLSTGITGADLPVGLKLLLCADMLLGRVEMVAVLILFYPRTWFASKAG